MTLAPLQGQWVAGGRFNQTGSTPLANALAQWDEASQTWQPFSGGGFATDFYGVNPVARALLADGNLLYVAGEFAQTNGISLPANHGNRAVYNAASQTWNPLVGSHDPAPYDSYFRTVTRIYKSPSTSRVYFSPGMVAWDGSDFSPSLRVSHQGNGVYWLLGDFTSINRQPYGNLARYNTNTSAWENVGGGFASPICNDYFYGFSNQFAVVLCDNPTTVYVLQSDDTWLPITTNNSQINPGNLKPLAQVPVGVPLPVIFR